MQNSLGVTAIYLKALWITAILILAPLGIAIIIGLSVSNGNWSNFIVALGIWAPLLVTLDMMKGRPRDILQDALSKQATWKGTIGGKWAKEKDAQGELLIKDYNITVNNHSFNVSENIYNWLSEGNKILIYYYPYSQTVIKVKKLS